MGRRKTHEEFVKQMKDMKPNIEVLGEYQTENVKIKCRCKICDNIWEPTPHDLLQGSGCVQCSKNKLRKLFSKSQEDFVKDINRINKNILVLGKYINMKTNVLVQCKLCNNKFNLHPNNIYNRKHISCPVCDDGISYPNKFIAKLLAELNIEFEREVLFDWCKYPCYVDNNKQDYGIYDFVIPKMNLIIEADGELGHGKNTMTTIRHNRRKITPAESLYRDQMKDALAIKNGYNIIRIDCSYNKTHNRFDTIVQNIKTSELSQLFNLEGINFDDIEKYCIENSYIVDASNMWNNGMSVHEISNKLKISRGTITSYLHIGSKNKLCDYNKSDSVLRGCKKSNRRVPYMIIYDNKKEIFSTITEMIEYYNLHYNIKLSKESIRRNINNNLSYKGRTFYKISHEDFNYYKNNSLADLVVGETFLIVA